MSHSWCSELTDYWNASNINFSPGILPTFRKLSWVPWRMDWVVPNVSLCWAVSFVISFPLYTGLVSQMILWAQFQEISKLDRLHVGVGWRTRTDLGHPSCLHHTFLKNGAPSKLDDPGIVWLFPKEHSTCQKWLVHQANWLVTTV